MEELIKNHYPLIMAITSILSIIVAGYALRISSKERKLQIKPHIVIDSTYFNISYRQIDEQYILFLNTNDDYDTTGYLGCYNVGNGAALNVNYDWNIDEDFYKDIYWKLNSRDLDISIYNGEMNIELGNGEYLLYSNNQSFDTIHPNSFGKQFNKINIPYAIPHLLNLVKEFDRTNKSKIDELCLLSIPPLELIIKYEDIEGKKYLNRYKIMTRFSYIDLEEKNEYFLKGEFYL